MYKMDCSFFVCCGINKVILGLGFISLGILIKSMKYGNSRKHVMKIGLTSLPLWLLFGLFLNDKVTMYRI